jgi:hypothetical protein
MHNKKEKRMRRTSLIVFVLVMWLATCKSPEPNAPPPMPTSTATSTPTQIPATETPVPPTPTETAVPQGKLPAAPFDAQTYINEEAGFALEIPAAWTIKETVVGPRGTQISFVSKPDLAEAATIPAGETRISATIYKWDPKNDLPAYVEHWKGAWEASGFKILEEESLTLELGLPAEQFTLQTPDMQTVILVTALKDQYLVISGEGDLELAKVIMQRLRPVS